MKVCASSWSYEDEPALRLSMDTAARFPARLPNFKASCLSGFGSGSGAEGRPVCGKHRHGDLIGLFEAGQFSVTGSPKTQSKQCAMSKDPRLGQTSQLAVTAAAMRECLLTSKQSRDI